MASINRENFDYQADECAPCNHVSHVKTSVESPSLPLTTEHPSPKRLHRSRLRNVVTTVGLGLFAAVTQPPWWRILKGLTLVCHKISPVRHVVPNRLSTPLQKVWKPVLGLQLCTWLAQQYAPIACRTLHLWQGVLRVYSMYMWTKHRCNKKDWTEEDISQLWAARHEWGGEQVHHLVLSLSGYYVKAAQILATKQEFMPQQWTARLSGLFDQMPPQPWELVKSSIDQQLQLCPMAAAALGEPWSCLNVFSSINIEPAASASIAQVHFAELSQEATQNLESRGLYCKPEVAVKVQHVGVELLMVSDLINLGLLARFLRHVLPFDPIPVVDEIRESIPREFDFNREREMMALLKGSLLGAGIKGVNIPSAISPLCTSRLLVQERMYGLRFTTLLQQVSTDPALKLDAQAAVMKLLVAYGHMILRQGVFHADPHPGNLLLQDGNEVALLDFGQVGVLNSTTVRAFAHLVLAIHSGSAELMAWSAVGLGLNFAPRKGGTVPSLQHVAGMICVMLDTRPMPEACLNPFDLSHHPMFKETSISSLPSHMWMLVRTFMLLRGLTHALDMSVSTASLWKDVALAALADPLVDSCLHSHVALTSLSCMDGMVDTEPCHYGWNHQDPDNTAVVDQVMGSCMAASWQLQGERVHRGILAGNLGAGSCAAAPQLPGVIMLDSRASNDCEVGSCMAAAAGAFLDWPGIACGLCTDSQTHALMVSEAVSRSEEQSSHIFDQCSIVGSESGSDGGRRDSTLGLAVIHGSEDSRSEHETVVIDADSSNGDIIQS